MMDAPTFLTRYPEFATVDPDLIAAVLAEVTFGLDTSVYGPRLAAAQAALAAHRLWLSPAGVSLRGDSSQSDSSDYLKLYRQINREVSIGFAVIC